MRGMRLRWPLKKLTNGRPIDLINFEQKAALLAGGYALVTIDVRGTGARPCMHLSSCPCLCTADVLAEHREQWRQGQALLHHIILSMGSCFAGQSR